MQDDTWNEDDARRWWLSWLIVILIFAYTMPHNVWDCVQLASPHFPLYLCYNGERVILVYDSHESR